MTPEGKVKKEISAYLTSLTPDCCYKMPVPCGFGKSGVDYDVTYYGISIAIEAKKKGVGKGTPREEAYLEQVRKAGGIAFVADDVAIVKLWMEYVKGIHDARAGR